MNFVSEFFARLQSKSPEWFVRFRYGTLALAVVVFVVNRWIGLGLITTTPLELKWWSEITKGVAYFFTGAFGTSFLPCQSANDTASK